MPYHILVQFDIPEINRQHFISAALKDASDSLANEPGTLSFKVLEDEEKRNRFYLSEVYESKEKFEEHCQNKPFLIFFASISDYASTPVFLCKGHSIDWSKPQFEKDLL